MSQIGEEGWIIKLIASFVAGLFVSLLFGSFGAFVGAIIAKTNNPPLGLAHALNYSLAGGLVAALFSGFSSICGLAKYYGPICGVGATLGTGLGCYLLTGWISDFFSYLSKF